MSEHLGQVSEVEVRGRDEADAEEGDVDDRVGDTGWLFLDMLDRSSSSN